MEMPRGFIFWIAFCLVLLLGITALFGGAKMMIAPDGTTLELQLSWLKETPFSDYYFPGLILFFVLGTGSILNCAEMLFIRRISPYWVVFTGTTLVIWISVQIIMIGYGHPIQIAYGILGLLILGSGLLLRQQWKAERLDIED